MRTIVGLLAALMLSSTGWASSGSQIVGQFSNMLAQQVQRGAAVQVLLNAGLNWHVGDHAEYDMSAGFVSGTIASKVREVTAQGFWVDENADLGFAGQHVISELVDKNDGHIIKMTVDGKDQTPPQAGDEQVVQMKQDHITVKAGSFDVIYVQLKDKKTGDTREAWVNPKLIPILGLAKAISPSQMGQTTLELDSFGFGS